MLVISITQEVIKHEITTRKYSFYNWRKIIGKSTYGCTWINFNHYKAHKRRYEVTEGSSRKYWIMMGGGGGEGHLPFTCLKAHRNFDLFKISFPSFYIRKGPVPKPLTIEHQCAYSSYCSIYISLATNMENSFINQELLWVAIISSFSRPYCLIEGLYRKEKLCARHS